MRRPRAPLARLVAVALWLAGCQAAHPAAIAPPPGLEGLAAAPVAPATLAPAAAATMPPVFPSLAPRPRASAPASRARRYDPAHTVIPFSSNRPGGCGGFDLYLYDLTAQTVVVPPGANTPGDEFNPSASWNGRWLVYATDGPGHFEVWLYDLSSQLVNPLPELNTGPDQESPTISGDGTLIAYQTRLRGRFHIRLFDLRTRQNYALSAIDHLNAPAVSPFISADGRLLAFSSPVPGRGLDIFLYAIAEATVWSPPFLNTAATEDEPVLSPHNRRLVFSTNRRGNQDVMLANLRTGVVDPLPLANSPADDLTPSFVGPRADRIVFVSDRTGQGDRRLMLYDLATHALDTLPVAHAPGSIDTFSPP